MLTTEEIRVRTQKRHRILILLLVLLLVLLLGFFAGPPAGHAIKAWQARRHAQKAFVLLEQGKWIDARDEAVAAYQLRPTEPQALRAVARYLSRTRQQQALEFWKQLQDRQPLTREDRRDEASIALLAGDLERAETVVNILLANDGKDATARDWLLAAQCALQKGKLSDGQSAIQKVFADPKVTDHEKLQAAVLELQMAGSSNDEDGKQHRAEAWARMNKLAQGQNDIALDALILLAHRALSSQAVEAAVPAAKSNSLAGDAPATTPDLIHALENHPLAKAPQKLLALDLQMHEQPAEKENCISRAIEQWKEGETPSLVALATWLNGHGEYQKTLEAIPVEKALQSRELLLQHLDALGALSQWDEIRKILESEKYPLDPVFQRMYLARCNAQLGEKTASENNWQRALESARNDAEKLLTLADYAEKNGALEIAETAYNSAAVEMPKLRVAQQGRLRVAQARRDTKKIHAVLTDMLKFWPNDSAIQNDEAYTRLLLISSQQSREVSGQRSEVRDDEELIAIEKLADELVKREPASLPHRTLLALARLKQHRPVAALDVYANIQVAPNALSPSALAVHAAVLAANDRRDDARNEIQQAPLEKLLPEEQAGTADLRD